jgi:hypothetical protein
LELLACVGEGGIYVGAPSVAVIRDPTMTEDDLTVIDVPAPFMDRPTHASGVD